MARPTKRGFDYFSLDCDQFQDRKIKRLIRAFGGNGYAVYMYLLTQIYSEDCFLRVDEEIYFDISEAVRITEAQAEEIVLKCLELELFSKRLFNDLNILTSKAIQSRWIEITTSSKRTDLVISEEMVLIPEETRINSGFTKVNSEETNINSGFSTQSKVKESKGKKSKGKEREERANETVFSNDPKPNLIELKKQSEMIGVSNAEFEAFVLKFESQNWHDVKDGSFIPVQNWAAKLNWYKVNGYLKNMASRIEKNSDFTNNGFTNRERFELIEGENGKIDFNKVSA